MMKRWYESKAVWGGVVALVCGAAGVFGIIVPEQDMAALEQSLLAIGSAVGGILAIYGRVNAKTNIK
jgi:hypothetical protein